MTTPATSIGGSDIFFAFSIAATDWLSTQPPQSVAAIFSSPFLSLLPIG
jgi:hypothetical protein